MARVHQELDIFWQANRSTENKIFLWETSKVFLRGIFICQKAYLKRMKHRLTEEWYRVMTQLEESHKVTPIQES